MKGRPARIARTTGLLSRWGGGIVLSAILGASLAAFAPSVASADAPAECGSKDNPCPLQKWMRANLGTALAANDSAALAANLNKVANASPDATWNWKKIASDGAAAAGRGDIAGAKAACKSCHDAYKDQYKHEVPHASSPGLIVLARFGPRTRPRGEIVAESLIRS